MDKQSILLQIDALEKEALEIELSRHKAEMEVEIEAIKHKYITAAKNAVSSKYEELRVLVNQLQEQPKPEPRILQPQMTQPTILR